MGVMFLIIEVVRATITDEERQKRLNRISFLAGVLVKGIVEKQQSTYEGAEKNESDINISHSGR